MPTFIDSYPVTVRVMQRVRELNPQIITLIGGALVSSLPEPLIIDLKPDYTILGEGEATLLELLDHIEAGGTPQGAVAIPGLGLLIHGVVCLTPSRAQLMDLDVLPISQRTPEPGDTGIGPDHFSWLLWTLLILFSQHGQTFLQKSGTLRTRGG
jgi:radical SAM superfamily enzyme YgiQ (UPF0313 family)